MKRRNRVFEVYSMSAIDLFASAMGAFIIISIILMPDYQKEVRSQGDLQYLEELAGQTDADLEDLRRRFTEDAESRAERLNSALTTLAEFRSPEGQEAAE